MAERVDDVALETVGRAEKLVDDEFAREGGVDPVGADGVDPAVGSHRFGADAFDGTVDEALRLGQSGDVALHERGEFGIDLADAGDQPQAHFVAQVFGRPVGRVLAEADLVGDGIFQNLLARGEHQRAHDAAHLLRDARQPAQARAAQQIDEESLDRVVGVVGHGDGRVAVFAPQFLEPGVAQAPRRHLHRFARAFHLGLRVEAAVVAHRTQTGRFVGDQHFVFVALGAPQLEVAVRHAHAVAAPGEERQHDHRVHAARDRQQYPVVACQQPVFFYVMFECLGKGHSRFII